MFECAICGDIDSYTTELLSYHHAYICQFGDTSRYGHVVLQTPTYTARCLHCRSAIEVYLMDETNFIVREILREYINRNRFLLNEYIQIKI